MNDWKEEPLLVSLFAIFRIMWKWFTYRISPVGYDCGPRKGAVNCEYDTLHAIGSCCPVLDIKPVFPDHPSIGDGIDIVVVG